MYRDNLEAAHMRIAELEKENKELERKIGKYIQQGICPNCDKLLDKVPGLSSKFGNPFGAQLI